jgi:hypothetical protein
MLVNFHCDSGSFYNDFLYGEKIIKFTESTLYCSETFFIVMKLTEPTLYCSENRGEFLEKLQRARSQIKVGTPSQPILSNPTSSRLVVGNWTLSCKRTGELQIHNSDGQQVCVPLLLEKFKTK